MSSGVSARLRDSFLGCGGRVRHDLPRANGAVAGKRKSKVARRETSPHLGCVDSNRLRLRVRIDDRWQCEHRTRDQLGQPAASGIPFRHLILVTDPIGRFIEQVLSLLKRRDRDRIEMRHAMAFVHSATLPALAKVLSSAV